MSVPLPLDEVLDQTPSIQYVAQLGQTIFPYPFAITQDSDLVLYVNGDPIATDSGYTLTGQGNDTGGNLVLNSGATALDIYTLVREIPIERLTQFAQNGGFSSASFNNEFNNVYLILQQLQDSISDCFQLPVSQFPTVSTTFLPATWKNSYLAFDANGNPTPVSTLTNGLIQYPVLASESGKVVNAYYAYGNILRYGADPTGVADSTAAIQAAISCFPNGYTIFAPIGTYKVSASLVFPTTWLRGRFTGAGWNSVFIMSGSSFDMFTWAEAGGPSLTYTNVDNFCISGQALTGSGNLINTQYASTIQMQNLLLLNFCTTGNGIAVVGYGTTATHDILVSNIYYETATGNAAVFMGAYSSDSIIEKVVGNGSYGLSSPTGCSYGIYVQAGASHHYFSLCHPYNHGVNSLYVGAGPVGNWFAKCRFEMALNDSAYLTGAVANIFDACIFSYAPANYSCLKLVNSTGNRFPNCSYVATSSTSKYAINETGSSNGNCFDGFVTEGSFTATPAFVLVGSTSSLRANGSDQIMSGGPTSIAAGATIYQSYGPTACTSAGSPCIYGGYATQLLIECDTDPGNTKTLIATLMLNGSPTALTVTLTGNGSTVFSAAVTGVVFVTALYSACIKIVSSSGATTTNVRASVVINQ